MLPLNPPVSKEKLIDVKLFNFPIYDQNGEIFDKNSWPTYHGIFNGKVVIIKDSNDISRLSNSGSFGQLGVIDKDKFIDYKTLQNQVLNQKKNWHEMELVPFEFPSNFENKEVGNNHEDCQSFGESSMSLSDNKNTDEEYIEKINLLKKKYPTHSFENIFAIYPQENNIIDNLAEGTPTNWKDLKTNFSKEFNELLILSGHVHDVPYYLLLEEAFFLCYTLECLDIQRENGSIMSASECWKEFNILKKDFSFFYASYHYYRSKGWVVKPGQQYGGDYVLYKMSPTHYHSSYVVVVSVNGQNSELLSSWPTWFGCSRVIEAASKDLIISTVHGPAYEEGMPIDLTQYTVMDTIVRRWVPSQNRIKPKYC